jgi:hypothetical protein
MLESQGEEGRTRTGRRNPYSMRGGGWMSERIWGEWGTHESGTSKPADSGAVTVQEAQKALSCFPLMFMSVGGRWGLVSPEENQVLVQGRKKQNKNTAGEGLSPAGKLRAVE